MESENDGNSSMIREHAITLLRSQGLGGGGEVEGEAKGWSVACTLDDADKRPLPSSLVARCDMTEALTLARVAAPRSASRMRGSWLQRQSLACGRSIRKTEKKKARRVHAVSQPASFGGGPARRGHRSGFLCCHHQCDGFATSGRCCSLDEVGLIVDFTLTRRSIISGVYSTDQYRGRLLHGLCTISTWGCTPCRMATESRN
jgi:hypothetical protein